MQGTDSSRPASDLTQTLAAPFNPEEVRFKPKVVQGNRALALAYVDARVIQDRLDEVLGVEGWQDEYECLPDGSVVCRLRLRLGSEWITKMDVGGPPSEQSGGGDRLKAAFSDALKRAAVKFGIGRYLYRVPSQWVDWDPQRRQFTKKPALPAFALPRQPSPSKSSPPLLPTNGTDLLRRLSDYDAKLATEGLCERGALVRHITHLGERAGHGNDLTTWSGPAIALAVEETKRFETQKRQTSAKKRVA